MKTYLNDNVYRLKAKLSVTVTRRWPCGLCIYILLQSLSISPIIFNNFVDSFLMSAASHFSEEMWPGGTCPSYGIEWDLSREKQRERSYVYIYSVFKPPLLICDLDSIPAHLPAFHPPIFCENLQQR